MKIGIFKRIIVLFLVFMVLFSVSLSLFGCGLFNKDSDGDGFENGTDSSESATKPEHDEHWLDKVILPEGESFGRETVDFDKIEYVRPNFDATTEKLRTIISAIEKNEISFEEQIAMIEALEGDYEKILTMRTLADISVAKDSSSEYWNAEYAYVTGSYPNLAKVIEQMYVAAANSPHAERFEDEYFGDGLIEEYKDGGKLTDTLVKLLESEEALEAEYLSLTESDYELEEKQTRIFIELVKVRRMIANELGDKSYADYAYETLGRDYSADKASRLLDDIAEYILPTYQILAYTSLSKYVYGTEDAANLGLADLMNNSRELLRGIDESYGEIFNYMLSHKLFDVDIQRENRNEGAFVTYLEEFDAPFLFLSAGEDITDYTAFLHEFGHFIDAYTNLNSDASIDQKEISSQALEYLSLTRLDGILSLRDARYLTENQTLNAMITLIFQGFYAKAEELIYALPLENITKESLDREVVRAAEKFGLNTEYINSISAIFISHTFLYPFYVQSYCTSLVPSLEIYFMEIENEGSGFEAYKKLIDRSGENFTLEEALSDSGIASPFKEDIVLEIAGKILSYVQTGTLPERKNEGLLGVA